MALVVNHNMMAMNAARNLNASYNRLNKSVQRLSSGLRVNSAADDAAGLAIRELMRADIATLNQGVRNANDAISLIQVADGALGVIDEKLIRMKELAEQAATGTYNSTQRLMIESEYQAMASEITRIANATDFNGVKLLDGTLSRSAIANNADGKIIHDGSELEAKGALKIHFGVGNDSAEDYYYINIGCATASALGVGNYAGPDSIKNGGYHISTQEAAQKALDQLNKAIESKDNIRAALGAFSSVFSLTSFSASLTRMSAAEARVNVTISMSFSRAPRTSLFIMRAIITVVLPLPAPAETIIFPSSVTARS